MVDEKARRFGKRMGIFLLLLSTLVFTGISEAAVTLSPRYISGGTPVIDAAREQYVYFGKYDHRLATTAKPHGYDGPKESDSDPISPILWRVMELNDHVSGKGAILLSHYVLESMAYQGTYTDSGAAEPNRYVRPSTLIPIHTWDGSEVQTWLNSSSASVTVNLGKTGMNTDIKGFLHSDYFSILEQGAMLDYPYNRYSEGEDISLMQKIVLPSGMYKGSGPYFDKYEMGTWFASEATDANKNTRKTHFKGGPTSFTLGAYDGRNYWTRSPVASHSTIAYEVYGYGNVLANGVDLSVVAVRPAFFLNLESLIFKSASEDFVPGPPSAAAGGSPQNPYILVLPSAVPSGTPAGWTTTFVSADKVPDGAVINGKAMTVSWDVPLSPAVKRWPAPGDFTLNTGEHPTNVTSDDANPKLLKLTFATGAAYGAAVTLSYNLNTDAISHDSTGSPVKVVASFASLAVTNTTTQPVVPPPSTLTKPSNVGVTLGGVTYPAQVQTDVTYLITLPTGTSLSAVTVGLTLPTGATISPSLANPFDFTSENPRKFTITAEDGTTKQEIWIKMGTVPNPAPTEKALLTVMAGDCAIIYTLNADGSVSVEIQIQFASGVTPSDLENLTVALKGSCLSNIKFAYVNAVGTVVPYTASTRAAAGTTKAPYLRISGTAASVAALANEAITSVNYKTKGNTAQYVQMFANGGLKLSSMNVTDNTKPEPEPEPKTGGGGGCNSGVGFSFLALGLVLALKRGMK